MGLSLSKQDKLIISSCHTTVELHDKRHRQIASIVQSIQRLDRVHVTVKSVHSERKKEERRKCWDENDADPGPKDSTQERGVEWDNQSSTMNDEEAEDKQQHWTADTRKVAKAERKAAKNQTRFNVITQDDMENVQRSLHPELGEAAEGEKQSSEWAGPYRQQDHRRQHCFQYSYVQLGLSSPVNPPEKDHQSQQLQEACHHKFRRAE